MERERTGMEKAKHSMEWRGRKDEKEE
jgi:hypothetical protein